MSPSRFSLVLIFFFFAQSALSQQTTTTSAQSTIQRDPQAVAVMQKSYAAMGGTLPNDSIASGTVKIVAGSLVETGTIQVLTKGTKQSLELVITPSVTRSLVFSRDQANEQTGTVVTPLYLERAASSQSVLFPLILVADALGNPDAAIQYVGTETFKGTSVLHIRTWNTYVSQPDWQGIAEFTMKDFWFDSQSAFPSKISYTQRQAGGNASPGILIQVFYSAFQNFAGVFYPSSATKLVNGTPWMTVQVNSVSFNTGLTDASFPILLVTP